MTITQVVFLCWAVFIPSDHGTASYTLTNCRESGDGRVIADTRNFFRMDGERADKQRAEVMP